MSQPLLDCPYCENGTTDDGLMCGWCVGMGRRAYTCDLCKLEDAVEVTEMGEYLCATCKATNERNEVA